MHRYSSAGGGDDSSEQEDLVDASGASEMENDETDMEEVNFANYKPDMAVLNSIECNDDEQSVNACKVETKLKLAIIGVGLCLLIATFLLLCTYPLYLKQLELGGENYNAFGSLLFVSSIITTFYVIAAAASSWHFKWDIKFYQLPIPAKG